jgi:hypothetical protein
MIVLQFTRLSIRCDYEGALGYPSNSGTANLARKGPWTSRSGAEAPAPGPGLTALGPRVCDLRSSF